MPYEQKEGESPNSQNTEEGVDTQDVNEGAAPSDAPKTQSADTDDVSGETSVADAMLAQLQEDGLTEDSSTSEEGAEKGEDKTSDLPPEQGKAEAHKKDDGAKEGEDADEGDEDETPPPFAEHPAWKRQLAKRKEAEERYQKAEQELKPAAEQWTQLQQKFASDGMTGAQVAEALDVAAMINKNPSAALPALRNILAQVENMVGERLPPELQKAVEAGEITKDHALNQSRLIASQRRTAQTLEQRQQQEIQNRQTQMMHSAASAVTQWEDRQASSDPDWSKKQPGVQTAIQAGLSSYIAKMHAGEVPQLTPEKAVEIATKAKQDVDNWFKNALPPKTEVKPVQGTGAGDTTSKPRINDTFSAMMAAAQAN